MHSIRKFVGRGTLALGISVVTALAFAVQAGQAARITDTPQVASSSSQRVTQTSVHLHFALSSPSPACSSALSQLQAAFAKDVTEDMSERSANTTDTEAGADQTEDTGEAAAFKPFISAVVAACGATAHEGTRVPPTTIAKTPACTAALQALKSAFAAARAEQQTELTSGTEGTPADQTEDQAAFAHVQSLWAGVKSACSTGSTTGTSTFDTWWQHR